MLRCVMCSVFSDRLVDDKDMESFVAILTEKLGLLFDQTFHNICPGKQPPVFGENLFVFFLQSCELLALTECQIEVFRCFVVF